MNKWIRMKVGEVSESCLGKMLDKDKNKGELQPYLSNKSVRWGAFDLDNLSLMRFEDGEDERYGLNEGDLVVCEGGEPGRCAIWNGQLSQMKIQKALHRVRVKPNYSNQFLYYQFLLAGKSGELGNYCIGSTIKHLTGINLKQIEFNFPPLPIQDKIAAVLSTLDAKIELNNRINAELEAMAKTLYDYWFVQFDFPNTEGVPYKTSGGKMVWNEEMKREIPEDFQVVDLSEIANITMGQSPPGESYNNESKGMIFFQGCTDFGTRFPSVRLFTTAPTRFAKTNDILLSVRAPVGTLNIANQNCCIGRGLAALNSKDNANTFLFGVLTNLKQIFDRRNTDGTTFGSITKDDLYSLKVINPADEILKTYEDTIKAAFEKQNKIDLENQTLTTLRDWLLPMLMNGQVTVK
jgi:type I restriction enzyme, S subunit